MSIERMDRAVTLLRAAYHLLKRVDECSYILNFLEETVYYDGADRDGRHLMEDIADELGIEEPN